MSDLASQHCEPCRGGMPPMTPDQIAELLPQLDDGWSVVDHHHLVRSFSFADFAASLAFVNQVGALAERAGHHPDIRFGWGHATIELWTHKIDGLHLADFVLAAQIDEI